MIELFDAGRQLSGHELDHGNERWMLLQEVKNDCFYAIRVNDPHPRQVYFIHVTWEEGEKEQAVGAMERANGARCSAAHRGFRAAAARRTTIATGVEEV